MNAPPKARPLWLGWPSGILLLAVVGIVIARRGEALRVADLLKQGHGLALVTALVPLADSGDLSAGCCLFRAGAPRHEGGGLRCRPRRP